MKLYKQTPDFVIRLCIRKQGEEMQYINVDDCTLESCKEELQKIISLSHKVSPFNTGKRTSIDIREAIGAKNGKSISLTFFGLSTKETKELIINHITKQND